MERGKFAIANLNGHQHLVKEIQALESRMKEHLGHNVALVAYSESEERREPYRSAAARPASDCRAGLDD